MGKVKPFIEFQINLPHVPMSADTSHNKYISLRRKVIFWTIFLAKEKTGFENKT